MSVTVAALCRAFLKGKSQCASAHVYFDKLMLSIDAAMIPEWEEQMTAAEAVRLQHPEAMDYLKARSMEDTSSEDQSDAMADGDSGITAWFELAIQVEEIQYAQNPYTSIVTVKSFF